MSSRLRLLSACALFSSWMILLMTGFVLDGWTHLLAVASLALFAWAQASAGDPPASGDGNGADAPR